MYGNQTTRPLPPGQSTLIVVASVVCTAFELALEKLALHHRCIHVHANNFSTFNIIEGLCFPETIEVTYCAKATFDFAEEPDFFPTEFDQPCDPASPDLYLGQFKFR